MAKQLQIRGGTTAQHSTFTGAVREITVDTDKDVVVVHDGSTAGGFPLAKQTSVDAKVAKVTSTDNAVVRFNGTTGEVQNSGVIIDDSWNVGIGMTPLEKLYLYTGSASNVIIKTQNSAASCQYGNDNVGYAYAWSADAPAMFVGTSKSDGSIRLYAGGGEKARIDSNGNLLLQSGTGALGYGTGAGGTVTQLTSKSTAVTLNKPTGEIVMNNSALAAGAIVEFSLNNSVISPLDLVVPVFNYSTLYTVNTATIGNGACSFVVQNRYSISLSEPVKFKFFVVKGATA